MSSSADQLPEMPDDFDRVLAVVAHPDDLEYGASGAIAVWTASGKTVTYLLVSRGEAGIDGLEPSVCGPLRAAEQLAAAKCVGVDVVEFLDHRDGVIEHTVELRRDIAGAIRRHRPDVVVIINYEDTWFGQHWNSPDHRNTGRAVLDAIGDAGNRWIFPEQITAGVEPWGGVRMVAVSGSSAPTHAVAIADGLEPGDRIARSARRVSRRAHRRHGRRPGVPHGDGRVRGRTPRRPPRRAVPRVRRLSGRPGPCARCLVVGFVIIP